MKKLRLLLWVVVFYAAAVAQLGLRPAVAVHGVAPDWLWAVATLAVFSLPGPTAVAAGSLAALLADCLSSRPLGCGVLAVAVTSPGFLCGSGGERRRFRRPLAQAAFVSTSLLVRDALAHAVTDAGWRLEWLLPSLGEAAYTLAVVFAVSAVLLLVGRLWRRGDETVGPTPQLLTNRWSMLTPE